MIGYKIVFLIGIFFLYIILIMGKCRDVMIKDEIRNYIDNIKIDFF